MPRRTAWMGINTIRPASRSGRYLQRDHNQNISRADLGSYGDVINYAVFGEIASFNDETVLRENQIGRDKFLALAIKNGILHDDSQFGRYKNQAGDDFTDIVPAEVANAPYTEAFATAIHAMGFHALAIVFAGELRDLWQSLPRLAFQLTNDHLATDDTGGGDYRATYDFLDALMLDHLNHGVSAQTVARAMIDDLQEIAVAGAGSSALADPDINTGIIQLAIQYAATQTLGDSPAHLTNGIVTSEPGVLKIALAGGPWGSNPAEGAHLIQDYAAFLLGDAASLTGSILTTARTLFVEANDGQAISLDAPGPGSQIIFGGDGDDLIAAQGGRDAIFGLAGADSLYGGADRDVLAGGSGGDTLRGGSGSDVLIGGQGADQMTGGADADRFVFANLGSGQTPDTVLDFNPGTDRLVFDNDAFQALGDEGRLSPAAFHIGPGPSDDDDRLIYTASTGTLLYDRDGAGGHAGVEIAIPGCEPGSLQPRLLYYLGQREKTRSLKVVDVDDAGDRLDRALDLRRDRELVPSAISTSRPASCISTSLTGALPPLVRRCAIDSIGFVSRRKMVRPVEDLGRDFRDPRRPAGAALPPRHRHRPRPGCTALPGSSRSRCAERIGKADRLELPGRIGEADKGEFVAGLRAAFLAMGDRAGKLRRADAPLVSALSWNAA